jgi:hypothetical protein
MSESYRALRNADLVGYVVEPVYSSHSILLAIMFRNKPCAHPDAQSAGGMQLSAIEIPVLSANL